MHDNFTSPDFYQIDDLLSEEHKLIRESTRQWVSKSVSPIIEDYAQKAEFPKHLVKELGEIDYIDNSEFLSVTSYSEMEELKQINVVENSINIIETRFFLESEHFKFA